MNQNMPSSYKKVLIITLSFLVLVALSIVGLKMLKKDATSIKNSSDAVNTQPTLDMNSWKVATDTDNSVSYKYPEEFSATYIHTAEWPPKLTLINGAFACVEAGTVAAREGNTESVTINGHKYCVTKEGEGAAGSTYINHSYTFPVKNKVGILTFSIREVQCLNYDDPQKSECQKERDAFTVDGIVDQMAQSITVK